MPPCSATAKDRTRPGVLIEVYEEVREQLSFHCDQPSKSELSRTIRLFAVHGGIDKDRLRDSVLRSFMPLRTNSTTCAPMSTSPQILALA